MIHIQFHCKQGGGVVLRVRGHAGMGAPGADPVCAAVSALTDTAAAAAEYLSRNGLLTGEPWIEGSPGVMAVIAQPKPEYLGEVLMVFWTIQVGLNALAKAYPQAVTMTNILKLERNKEETP